MHKTLDKPEEAPGIEIKPAQHDSLSMFLAALGGAVLGVLLTLLILAVINNGTLTFTSSGRLAAAEATLSRVNENVGTLSSNLDALATETSALRSDLRAAQDALRTELATQQSAVATFDDRLGDINTSLATLDATRQRFDTFVGALDQALNELDAMEGAPGVNTPNDEQAPFENP